MNNAPDQIARKRLVEQINRALGDIVIAALNADDVSDILLNEDGRLWIERFGKPMRIEGRLDAGAAMVAINAIASCYDTVCRADSPILSCELPGDGSRFEANVPPIVKSPTFSIRKKASKVFSLTDYTKAGIMLQSEHERIQHAVRQHENIIIAGSTGSGKTTLVNAIIAEIVSQDATERLFVLEDTPEIQCSAINKSCKQATETTTLLDLLKSALRQRPDRILIGEVRGAVAWDLLKAWNTGHPGGVCTLHADADPQRTGKYDAALKRLEQLSAENNQCPAAINILREVIGDTVGIIVYIDRSSDTRQRRINAIVEVISGAEKGYELAPLHQKN